MLELSRYYHFYHSWASKHSEIHSLFSDKDRQAAKHWASYTLLSLLLLMLMMPDAYFVVKLRGTLLQALRRNDGLIAIFCFFSYKFKRKSVIRSEPTVYWVLLKHYLMCTGHRLQSTPHVTYFLFYIHLLFYLRFVSLWIGTGCSMFSCVRKNEKKK